VPGIEGVKSNLRASSDPCCTDARLVISPRAKLWEVTTLLCGLGKLQQIAIAVIRPEPRNRDTVPAPAKTTVGSGRVWALSIAINAAFLRQ
jgi:hypothetical protein